MCSDSEQNMSKNQHPGAARMRLKVITSLSLRWGAFLLPWSRAVSGGGEYYNISVFVDGLRATDVLIYLTMLWLV